MHIFYYACPILYSRHTTIFSEENSFCEIETVNDEKLNMTKSFKITKNLPIYFLSVKTPI